jgi:hypothetical protein
VRSPGPDGSLLPGTVEVAVAVAALHDGRGRRGRVRPGLHRQPLPRHLHRLGVAAARRGQGQDGQDGQDGQGGQGGRTHPITLARRIGCPATTHGAGKS